MDFLALFRGASAAAVSASASDDVAVLERDARTPSAPTPRAPRDPLVLEHVTGADSPVFDELVRFHLREPRYWRETQRPLMTAPGVASFLDKVPPGATREQKFVWALRVDGHLVGCLDAVRSWPQRHIVTIGWLIVDAAHRREGLATEAFGALVKRCRGWPGVRQLRLSVVETQADAIGFWRAHGFRETGERARREDHLADQRVMARPLPR